MLMNIYVPVILLAFLNLGFFLSVKLFLRILMQHEIFSYCVAFQ